LASRAASWIVVCSDRFVPFLARSPVRLHLCVCVVWLLRFCSAALTCRFLPALVRRPVRFSRASGSLAMSFVVLLVLSVGRLVDQALGESDGLMDRLARAKHARRQGVQARTHAGSQASAKHAGWPVVFWRQSRANLPGNVLSVGAARRATLEAFSGRGLNAILQSVVPEAASQGRLAKRAEPHSGRQPARVSIIAHSKCNPATQGRPKTRPASQAWPDWPNNTWPDQNQPRPEIPTPFRPDPGVRVECKRRAVERGTLCRLRGVGCGMWASGWSAGCGVCL
jgi:hypothetical protein